MNYQVYNECIELSKKRDIHNEYITDGKFDIDKFKGNVNWFDISCFQELSEEFMKEFKDEVNWSSISWYQKLSEEFIREFNNEVVWGWISKYQILSEEFIIEFKDKVSWYNISCYQKLSEEFICENLNKIHIKLLPFNKKINLTKEFINKIKVLKMLIE